MSANDSELFNVDINNYNGPLDVLLDLAKAQKVDLEEISITKLADQFHDYITCLLYTSPSPRDGLLSRMPSSA